MPYPSRIDPESIGAGTLAVIEDRGWEHWSLRDVAAAMSVAPNALYRHVDGKRGLDVAAGAAAVREIHRALRGVERLDDPVVTVIHLARRYVAFAQARPDAFRAYSRSKPDPSDPRVVEWMRLWVTVRDLVAIAVPDAADAAAFALWALLDGRVDLASGAARLAAADAGLDDAVRALLVGFREAGPVASPLPTDLVELIGTMASTADDVST